MSFKKIGFLALTIMGTSLGLQTNAFAACNPVTLVVRININGVAFSVTEQTGCTSSNEQYFVFNWQPVVNGQSYGLEISSQDSVDKKALDIAISNRMEDGLSRSDIRYYRDNIIPLLQDASQKPNADEQAKALGEAREKWIAYLISTNP